MIISHVMIYINYLFFRQMDEHDRKREANVYQTDDIRILDDDLCALVFDFPNALFKKVGLI